MYNISEFLREAFDSGANGIKRIKKKMRVYLRAQHLQFRFSPLGSALASLSSRSLAVLIKLIPKWITLQHTRTPASK